jgi:putative heme-binding domain-containing protein
MKRGRLVVVVALACLVFGLGSLVEKAPAQQAAGVQWIWFNEGDPAKEAPAETRYFRKVFQINRPVPKPIDEATLDITADDQFTVWVNGKEVGKGNDAKRVYQFDIKAHLAHGNNVIAVQAKNNKGPAGLLVRIGYVPNGMSRAAQFSDGSWKASKTADAGWETTKFDDSKWQPAKVIGPYGSAGPWKGLTWDAGGDDRFSVPPGFKVEMVAKNPDPGDPFSLINLTFDNKGRLLVSKENNGILLCTQPNAEGVFQRVKTYCNQVRYCQGMCWVNDALLVVGNGPDGSGLYRVRDKHGDDHVDEVKLLHKCKGSMGEHGPHAIVHGPDGWLYLVIGNHASAKPKKLAANSPLTRWPDGQMGPDQDKPDTTEDVLLPRLNDAHGHAANIRAPGGTIWRLDPQGDQMSLVAAGFRNHYDAAFSPAAELFTFDSDMEWDEGLPWYRPVRVCHCPPGADFVWRTGAANTPNYYIDSLPPIAETGRGSPVGLDFYDHHVFPVKYQGAYFLGDWSLGIIWAVHLQREGASYKATAERFCQGAPMNVTDLAVGPDGALYFTMGGRSSQGGVYRIVFTGYSPRPQPRDFVHAVYDQPQPLAAWSRQALRKQWDGLTDAERLAAVAQMIGANPKEKVSTADRIKALTALQALAPPRDAKWLIAQMHGEADLRAHAVWLMGVNGCKDSQEVLVKALADDDALVRRRACEALIRVGLEPPVDAVWPLLGDNDRFVRAAARLVLERIEPKKWADRIVAESRDGVAWEGMIALCKTNKAAPYAKEIFARLLASSLPQAVQPMLDFLRTVQLTLIHTQERPEAVRTLAERCTGLFPHYDWRVNRELAILMAEFRRKGLLAAPVHMTLLNALLAGAGDRPQQIHYFYCLRLLHDGWTPDQRRMILEWFDSTKDWKGGYSFTGFLENILRDLNPIFTAEDRSQVLAKIEKLPFAATAMLFLAPPNQLPPPARLGDLYERLLRLKDLPKGDEAREGVIAALEKAGSAEAQAALRRISEVDGGHRDVVMRSLARFPRSENWAALVRGLDSQQALTLVDVIQALKKTPTKPNPVDPAPYRRLLLASRHLDARDRWKAVELLRHWTNDNRFGADDKDWKPELSAWSRWFVQTFSKEPALPDVASDKPIESKYKFAELLAFLDKDSAGRGNPVVGRAVFEKAQCIKCHKFGKDGEGIGPDLTTVSKRFKRADILESIIYPSKVISDQYRSTLIVMKNGKQIDGLAAPQGSAVTVLLSDGTKVNVKKEDIDQQFASLVSVMPERLLDRLSKQEIADLFAYLESIPPQ